MPDLHDSTSIGLDQAIRLASRVFAAYLLLWALFDLISLPNEFFSAVHYLKESRAAGSSVARVMSASYLFRSYVLSILANILRIALLLMAAGWFYRCGPRIRRFFGAGAD
jgi:hypothetical protein